MNRKNSKTSEPNRFRLNLTDKLDLKDSRENMALANLSICYTWKNMKSEQNNNKFKAFAPTWNDAFNLPEGSYSIPDIEDYFEFTIKNWKLCLKIQQLKFTQTKPKTEFFSISKQATNQNC